MPLQPLLLQTNLSIIIEGEVNGLLILFSTLAVIFDDLHKLADSLRDLRLFFEFALYWSAIVSVEQIPHWSSFFQRESSGFLFLHFYSIEGTFSVIEQIINLILLLNLLCCCLGCVNLTIIFCVKYGGQLRFLLLNFCRVGQFCLLGNVSQIFEGFSRLENFALLANNYA